ncbi:MAG: DUF6145 family protein [Lachnospiraceae bacterium]|nr:DUF6145 family protein [Lachnospiraceae bacterium]
MSDKKMQEIVLCGANAYEQKYYFNKEQFGKLPDEVQKELHIICVLFTEEVGGILTIGFDEEGELFLRTMADEYDFYYDDISAGMYVAEIRRKRKELFAELELFYRTFILGEKLE